MTTESSTRYGINQPIKLLVIEDDANDRDLLVHLIRKASIEDHIEFIDCGEKAIKYLVPEVGSEIFAIFLDIKLQAVDGLDVLRHIRSQEATAHLPVVVMTASKDPEHVRECERLHVTGFLTKPIEFPEFCRAVSYLLDRVHQEP